MTHAVSITATPDMNEGGGVKKIQQHQISLGFFSFLAKKLCFKNNFQIARFYIFGRVEQSLQKLTE